MRRLAWSFALVLSVASTRASAQPLDEESCPGVLTAWADVAACAALGLGGGTELGRLAQVLCIVDKIDRWGTQQLACLQKAVERRHRIFLYPDGLKRPMEEIRRIARQVDTLKQETERLACGWRYSPRTRVLQDLYLRPVKLCKPSFQGVYGSHQGFWDADVHELMDWTSTTTANLIQERTIGREPGRDGSPFPVGPEASWQRIAGEGVRDLSTKLDTPGLAVRFAAQMSADGTQVEVNTMGLRTQALLVEQQTREYKALKRQQGRAYAITLVSSLQAAVRPGPGRPRSLEMFRLRIPAIVSTGSGDVSTGYEAVGAKRR